jgi:hypothetical protein
VRAYPIPMEETATTVPRSTHPLRRIIPAAGPITLMVVTTRPRKGITHHLHGITSQRRVITISRGFINRHHGITSRRHEQTIGSIRIVDGTVMTAAVGTAITGVAGMMTIEVTTGRIIAAEGTAIMIAATAEAAAGKTSQQKAAHEAPLFLCPKLNTPTGQPEDAGLPRLYGNAPPPPPPVHC